MSNASSQSAMETITQGAVQVISPDALEKKLKRGKPLRVKLGVDPTAPDLHLGHTVVLEKLKQFQDLGHEVIFLIGNFTACIGDPSGKSKTRAPLTAEQVVQNTKTYLEQVGRIIDVEKAEVAYNASWIEKLGTRGLIELCSQVTLARLTERDDFSKRIAAQQPVGLHELIYPILQAYDSVQLQADVELGGTDQTFNLLMGRMLQERYDQEPQVVITMPLLEGTDGVQKMSKSLDNAISLADDPRDAYGKLMSISDEMMWRYFDLILHLPKAEKSQLQERIAYGTLHPMALKKNMARDVVIRYWSAEDAQRGQDAFEALFQKKEYDAVDAVALGSDVANPIWIVDLLKALGAIESSSEARRLIEAGAVQVDGEVVSDFKAEITWRSDMLVKVGKRRIYKIA